MSGNTHFDHGWRWRDLSKKDQRPVSYAIDPVHGLSFKPGTHEHSLPVSTLPDLVMELHTKFSTPERRVVAYKGGIQEKLLLFKLGLPYLDFEDFGCPSFEQLVKSLACTNGWCVSARCKRVDSCPNNNWSMPSLAVYPGPSNKSSTSKRPPTQIGSTSH